MAQEFRSGWFWRGVMAEFVGMILFIFIGLASAVGNKHNSGPDQEVKVALGFGLAVATLAQSLGHVSGAHLNPAVTVGALVSCRISALKALLYVSAQILGAVLASLIMSRLTPGETSLGVNSVNFIFCVYWAGPMLGGVAAALLYDFALQPHSEPYSRRIRALRGEVGVRESY
ncbi:aquaporin-2-like [Astyanax mexicanus]|uniref:aquaporin-2-like n=1 Tax=Astyanax mexicanus TaxID=7994 RepID=UPI0020CB256D|nr:aquaporin-2-like [Astyanax mexicanus]